MKSKILVIILSIITSLSIIFGVIGTVLFFEVRDEAEDFIENKVEYEVITKSEENEPQNIEEKISEDNAVAIALSNANLNKNEVENLYTHLEYDDGIYQYEIKFYKDAQEYEYNIDAKTGNILEKDTDYIFD